MKNSYSFSPKLSPSQFPAIGQYSPQNTRNCTPTTVAVTMTPARRTPAAMAANAGQKRKPSRKAIAQPVQAPVMGSGMATKMARAVNPKFSCS